MKLTPQHHKAIELFSTGLTNKAVAEELNIAPETISRWKSDFAFQAELNRLLRFNQEAIQDRLSHLSTVALDTIEAVMTDNEAPHKDRLTASIKLLEIAQVTAKNIGSTDPQTLEKEKAERAFLESLTV